MATVSFVAVVAQQMSTHPRSLAFVFLGKQLLCLHFFPLLCSSGGESNLQERRHHRGQSQVRGQMMALTVTTLYGNECGLNGVGFFFNALTVCLS